MSFSREQFIIREPIIAIVEAKNDNVKNGIPQCIAEMIGAQVFNEKQNNSVDTIYGVVTTGTAWLFLRLNGTVVSIDGPEYYISHVEKIVGIILAMLKKAKESLTV